MTRTVLWCSLFVVVVSCATPHPPDPVPEKINEAAPPPPKPVEPPVARKSPEKTEVHGDARVDDYAWMKKKGTPEIEAYLGLENAYTADWMKQTQPLQDTLYREMLSRVQENDTSAAFPDHGYEYYFRTEAGRQYRIECRRKLPDGKEEVLLDLNQLGRDSKFVGTGPIAVSDDTHILAYTLDLTGFRQYTLHLKDLESGVLMPETIERVDSIAWAADSRTFFYSTEDDTKRSNKVFRHHLGDPVEKDPLVYEEKDERFEVRVGRTRDRSRVIMEIQSHTTTEQRWVSAASPTDAFKTVLKRTPEVLYSADVRGDEFFILTNDKGRNNRLIKVPINGSDKAPKTELIPVRKDVAIDDFDVFKDFWVVNERADGLGKLRAFDFKTKKESAFEFPEQDYAVYGAQNRDFDTHEYRYAYESMITPRTTFARDTLTGKTRVVKTEPVPGYDVSKYESRRLFATAQDGTKIPISLAMKKGTALDGSAALYLHAYGSYGITIDAHFNAPEVSLLDRGVMVAWAHPRGGGEYGKPWHDGGRMMKKANTFSDFIDCAKYLIAEKYTSPERLAINGGSAGGLLMGGVLNMRPNLFKAALVEVPFVDVINTMLDESLPETVGEFEEWGNPKKKDEYDAMMAYSPYDNVKAQEYPAILVRSAYNDSQVYFHEPAKWVAKLRAMKTDKNPLLLRMEMDPAGHGGRSGRYDRLHDSAYYLSFVLTELNATASP